MLYWLGEWLKDYFGPFRLLTSHLFLGGFATVSCWLLTFWLLPRLAVNLPRDRGREFAVDSQASEGKPTGAGLIFITIFTVINLLFHPLDYQSAGVLLLTYVAMLTGWFDDKSTIAWSEYRKAFLDLVLSVIAAVILCQMQPTEMWLPFTKMTLMIPPVVFIPLATILIWTCINSTNCTDGVDGLSGTLVTIALLNIGALLYFVLGHKDIAGYLLLPHLPDGAGWGIMAATMVGVVIGYLWYNAHPSEVLMGDAGSRALGFLLGVLVIKTGNPFIVFIVSGVLLINGGTGLIKVALLRFIKISVFEKIRFPLHDHVRHNKGWSNTQVLVRFSVLQAMLTLIMIVLLVKVR